MPRRAKYHLVSHPTRGAISSRALIGIAVTVFWLGMMGTLVWRHVLPARQAIALAERTSDPAALTARWQDVSEAMEVRYQNVGIGAAQTEVLRRTPITAGFIARFRLSLGFTLLGPNRRIAFAGEATMDQALNLTAAAVQGNLGGTKFEVTALTVGEELLVELKNDGIITRTRVKLDRPLSLLEAVRPAMTQQLEIRPGASVAVPVVDPMLSMEFGTLLVSVLDEESIEVNGRTRKAFRVESRLNDFVSTSWVDTSGTTLRRQLAGNIMLDRTTTTSAEKTLADVTYPVIRTLNPEDFKGVPVTTLGSVGSKGGQSPLNILKNFAQ